MPGSRRPRGSPTKTSQGTVSEILALRKQLSEDGFDAGAQTIHTHLTRKHEQVPSPSTIWRVLKAQGLVAPQPHKRPRSSYVRFCAELPNELWQSDITCWREVEIMSVIDDHSRLCVAAKAFAQVRAADVVSTFYEAASRHGLPESLLSDNGAVFTAAPRNGRCAIESELIALGILCKHSRPYHPQTCGKVERFHQTLKKHLAAQRQARSLARLQAQIDRLRAAPAPGASAQDARRGLRRARQGRAPGQRSPASAPLPGPPRQGRRRRRRHAALSQPPAPHRRGEGEQGPPRGPAGRRSRRARAQRRGRDPAPAGARFEPQVPAAWLAVAVYDVSQHLSPMS